MVKLHSPSKNDTKAQRGENI